MPLPTVVQIVEDYKRLLEQNLRRDTSFIAKHFLPISELIQKEVERLYNEKARITNPLRAALWDSEITYYQSISEQMDNKIHQWVGFAQKYTYEQSLRAVEVGWNEAKQVIDYAQGTMPGYFKGLPTPQLESVFALLKDETPLKRVFNRYEDYFAGKLENTFMSSMAMGLPMRAIAERMTQVAEIGLAKALLISRTEVNRAHRMSTYHTYNKYGVVTKYKRMASKKHACMACLLLDGQLYTSKEMLDDHPNGACAMVPWVDGMPEPSWQSGKDYFLSLSEEEQRKRMGDNYYDAWKRKDFKLDDMTVIRPNPIWGGNPGIRPLKELSPDWRKYYNEKRAKLRTAAPLPTSAPVTGNKVVNGKVFTDKDWRTMGNKIGNLDTYISEGVSDQALDIMAKMQGYDGLPLMVTKEQYALMVKNGEISDYYRAFRGAEYADQFKTGGYWAGKGLYGNGTYVTPTKSVAEGYGETVINIGLRSDAKIIKYEELQAIIKQQSGLSKYAEELYEKAWETNDHALLKLSSKLNDTKMAEVGKLAVSLGYDAVDLGRIPHGDLEMIILNRTKTVVFP